MAERSFVEEVKKLRLTEGEVFSGEGILAVTKALLESGVNYVAGYQGAPISHLMDVLADAQDILTEYGIRFENSASEATAAATLASSVNYPLRGAVTFKAPVGTNVASDALANLSSGGVMGGALIIVGEDYGEGSSIMQERSHAFAMKSQMWMLDPRPNLESITKAVKQGFELSEASNTPVMLQLRIRSCHVHGQFVCSDNKKAKFTIEEAMENPQRDVSRIVLPPASFLHEHEKIDSRWPNAVKYIQDNQINEFFPGSDIDMNDVGILVQGGCYNTLARALNNLDIADAYGNSKVPIYVMNVAYPVVDEEVIRFCEGKKAVLLVEEGQPNFVEQNIAMILRAKGLDTALHGKDMLTMAGEYTTAMVLKGCRAFLEKYGHVEPAPVVRKVIPMVAAPMSAPVSAPVAATVAAPVPSEAPVVAPVAAAPVQIQMSGSTPMSEAPSNAYSPTSAPVPASASMAAAVIEPEFVPVSPIGDSVQGRPPGFCTGCPERPIFTAMKLVERELGEHHVSADIGCHLFSILPPFNLGNTTMGYGLGAASAAAMNMPSSQKRAISVMGDGGFWHNGLTSGIANSVFNKSDNLTIVVDNSYTSATGGQDILSSKAENATRSTNHAIEQAVRGVGVKWAKTVRRTYDLKTMVATLREALTTEEKGPKVLIAQSECMLNKQRREKPKVRKAIAAGERVVRERFGIDADTCTGDHSCIRLSGCPSLTIKPNPDPLRTDPIAAVLDSCVGCGLCGEVSHAAVLCPSFYRAEIISNPTGWDKFRAKIRDKVIGYLQARDQRRIDQYAF